MSHRRSLVMLFVLGAAVGTPIVVSADAGGRRPSETGHGQGHGRPTTTTVAPTSVAPDTTIAANDPPPPTPTTTVDPTIVVTTTVAATTTVVSRPLSSVAIVTPFNEALGFAEHRGLTGGRDGTAYVVTSAADIGPGTYREALSTGRRYVTFAPTLHGATIQLRSPVITSASHITVDGGGVDVTVSGYATKFSGTNIVVSGMRYRHMTGTTNEDALTFRNASADQVFGVFGNEFERATDGLIDVIWNRGHDVYGTICGNRFSHHDKAVLLHSGTAEDEGGTYHVTFCRNHWVDVYQRAPLSRDALVHQYNDVLERYGDPLGAGGGSKSGSGVRPSQHRLESNVAIPRSSGDVTFDGRLTTTSRREFAGPHLGMLGDIRIDGSLLLPASDGSTSATQLERERARVFTPPYRATVTPASRALRDAVTMQAGRCERPPSPSRLVNPCVPMLVVPAGGTVKATIGGDPTAVAFMLGETLVGTATNRGGGLWDAVLDPRTMPAGSAGLIRARAIGADGSVLTSSAVVVLTTA